MSKVYVITKGDYSDYHICGVALDKDKADKLAKMMSSRYDIATAEEYDTEQYSKFINGFGLYKVLRYDDGRVAVKEGKKSDLGWIYINEVTYNKYYDGYCVHVAAKDIEHAKKIGLDKIYQYKSEKELG